MPTSWPGYQAALRAALRYSFPLWERLGVHVTPNHYTQPIPNTRALGDAPWAAPSELAGIDMDPHGQLDLLEAFATRYRAEYERFPRRGTGRPHEYFLANSMFIGIDGCALYAMVRHFKPRRIVEVGSGFSTLVSAQALLANRRESGLAAELIAVEPEPRLSLRDLPGLTRLVTARVQDLELSFFADLEDRDILFLDSSHVLAIGSDVQRLFLEVLPRLNPGVLVHVHDVFLPGEYPRHWIFRNRWFWNEQYLLQAFLCFNDRFRVLYAGSYLRRYHPERLLDAFPCARDDHRPPGSFWMKRVG
jgi:predicted O-methyltransferase YrrM